MDEKMMNLMIKAFPTQMKELHDKIIWQNTLWEKALRLIRKIGLENEFLESLSETEREVYYIIENCNKED